MLCLNFSTRQVKIITQVTDSVIEIRWVMTEYAFCFLKKAVPAIIITAILTYEGIPFLTPQSMTGILPSLLKV